MATNDKDSTNRLAITQSNVQETTITIRLQLPTGGLWKKQVKLLLFLSAVVCGVIGNSVLQIERNYASGVPWVWSAFFIWLFAEAHDNWDQINLWWRRQDRLGKSRLLARIIPVGLTLSGAILLIESVSAGSETFLGIARLAAARIALAFIIWIAIDIANILTRRRVGPSPRISGWITAPDDSPETINPGLTFEPFFWRHVEKARIMLLAMAIFSSTVIWTNTTGNLVELPTILLWIGNAALWALVFAPSKWSFLIWLRERIYAFRSIQWRQHRWVIIAFMMIMVFGMGFRLVDLNTVPRDMIPADHADDILDAYGIMQGRYHIMMIHGQAREPMHMYSMALLAQLPGLGFNFLTLKLVSAIEGLLALPVLFWMGIELMGSKSRKLGIVVGLMLAGLVAVSYWHVVIARSATRSQLTTVFTALVMIYLARALRHNRRSDFVILGLLIGFGMYAAPSTRAIPLAVVAALVLSLFLRQMSWQKRLNGVIHLAVTGLVAFMICLPMYHFSLENPFAFSVNFTEHLFGVEPGQPVQIDMAIIAQTFLSNIGSALGMFNWMGDTNWRWSVSFAPALDIFTGSFLVLGAASWLVRLIKFRRDPVEWMVPVVIFAMLLPLLLNIAYPFNNPNNTRASGAIPGIYLIAAVPIACVSLRLAHLFPGKFGRSLGLIFCAAVLLLANHRNTSLFFGRFPKVYEPAPYSHIGSVMRGFAESDGAWGNAIIIPYPAYWDERNISIEAGQPALRNAAWLSDVPAFIDDARRRTDDYRLNPNRDLLFIYAPEDAETARRLPEWFPRGRELELITYVSPTHRQHKFMLYRAQALGEEDLDRFLSQHS